MKRPFGRGPTTLLRGQKQNMAINHVSFILGSEKSSPNFINNFPKVPQSYRLEIPRIPTSYQPVEPHTTKNPKGRFPLNRQGRAWVKSPVDMRQYFNLENGRCAIGDERFRAVSWQGCGCTVPRSPTDRPRNGKSPKNKPEKWRGYLWLNKIPKNPRKIIPKNFHRWPRLCFLEEKYIHPPPRKLTLFCMKYGWWLKSQGQPPGIQRNPINNGIPTSTGAGFQPSTVWKRTTLFFDGNVLGKKYSHMTMEKQQAWMKMWLTPIKNGDSSVPC